MPITYGSVCSGIEAATCAWYPLGWKAQWLAEIEPFPSAVLAHHYPATPNHGDMTRLAAQVLAGRIPAPDILVGGTPCPTLSQADGFPILPPSTFHATSEGEPCNKLTQTGRFHSSQ